MFDDGAFLNDVKHGARVKKFQPGGVDHAHEGASPLDTHESSTLTEIFRPDISLGENVSDAYSYLNVDGGWVNSKKGVEIAMQMVRDLGGQIHSGKEVAELIKAGSRTSGVRCKDGSVFDADIVVLATGSWTASSFPELKLGERCHATGLARSCAISLTLALTTPPDKV